MLNITFIISAIIACVIFIMLVADMANGHMYLSDTMQLRLGLIFALLLGVALFCHLKGL